MNVLTTTGSEPRQETHYSIVIPVYNEEDVVGSLLDELSTVVSTWRSNYRGRGTMEARIARRKLSGTGLRIGVRVSWSDSRETAARQLLYITV